MRSSERRSPISQRKPLEKVEVVPDIIPAEAETGDEWAVSRESARVQHDLEIVVE